MTFSCSRYENWALKKKKKKVINFYIWNMKKSLKNCKIKFFFDGFLILFNIKIDDLFLFFFKVIKLYVWNIKK